MKFILQYLCIEKFSLIFTIVRRINLDNMEELKALFDAFVAYCAKTPFHIAVLIGIAILIVGSIIALSIVGKKDKSIAQPQSPPPSPPQPIEEEARQKLQKSPAQTTKPSALNLVEEREEHVSKPLENTVEEMEDEFAEQVEEEFTEEEKTTEETPAKEELKTIETSNHKKEKNIKTADKEDVMLLDELKDIDTDIDFYEEDELDKMARYSGKWAICRVVTNDSANEDTFFFELRSTKGEQLFSSEEYTSYNGALRGVETHKSNILRNNFRIVPTKHGGYTFKLLNGKGMLLCMGNAYPTEAECKQAVEQIKRFARTAFIDENLQDVVVKVPEETNEALPPLPDGSNGKWIINCRTLENGERAFYFELLSETDKCLLSSEDYSSYIGVINSIQTHKTNIKHGNFRISLTKQGNYAYKLLNGNGQLLCLGDHYKTKRICEYVVEMIKAYAENSPVLTDPDLMQE